MDVPKFPPDCAIWTDGPVADSVATQNGRWRKFTESDGSRENLTEAGRSWRKQKHDICRSSICHYLPGIRRVAWGAARNLRPTSSSRHTDPPPTPTRRTEETQYGRWRKNKNDISRTRISIFLSGIGPGPFWVPQTHRPTSRSRHTDQSHSPEQRPEATRNGSWRRLPEAQK